MNGVVVCIIKQLLCSLLSYMTDSYQFIYDFSTCSIGMRATRLKFVCLRMSHYACHYHYLSQSIGTLYWLVAASKLHKGTSYTAEWPYCRLTTL